ncbi:MAG: transposase, partial [Thermoplasmata archaeon]
QYNEELVIRGEFYLDLSFVEGWGDEQEAMNRNRRGGQSKFPQSLMRWFLIWKQLLDYRGLEGIARKMSYIHLITEFPDFSTIWNRIHSSTPEISLPSFKEAEVGSDGTGLKTRNAGEYRILKYGDPDARQKKHLVVVITADVRHKKLLCMDVRIEGKGYTEASIAMDHLSSLNKKGIKIKSFYGDGAYDQSPVFNRLHGMGVKPVVKIRKNASADRYRGSKSRRRVVREYKMMGYERWARENNYGMRWPCTEGIFSAV